MTQLFSRDPQGSESRQPRLIPVLDVMGGVVVRAIGGRREEYRPIESRVTRSTQPVQVATDLLAGTGEAELYVADLDAIRGGNGISPEAESLCREVRARVWLDIGINALRPASLLPDLPNVCPVVGSETATDPRHLTETLASCRSRRVAFSIDLKAGSLLGNWVAWGAEHERDALGLARRVVALGVQTLIVLDLAHVGMGSGCGTEQLLKSLRAEFPDVELFAGGGVRTLADVEQLGQAGANAVLVASAIHDGSLGQRQKL
ncbi:MAG: HisA/HisF-related TIM barrel protein [Gemmataceae bacterium]